jgi:CheY-like chemotaxis protein
MYFSFENADADDGGYDVVSAMADADFAVVDADSKSAVQDVVLMGRAADSVFVGSLAPPGAGAVVPRPIDLPRILRALAELTEHRAGTTSGALPPLGPLDFADPDEIIFVDPPLLTDAVQLSAGAVAPDAAPASAPSPPSTPPDVAARKAKKAAARAAARRARLSHLHTDPGQLELLRDVLVLDADADASGHLRELLELFGFRVHVANNIAQAADVLSRYALVAAFLDIALDNKDHGDGMTFLQTIHDLPRLVGHPSPAVLIVTSELQPASRVRAALAGITSPLIKPVTRGDVARALEACDVALPADARRL